MRYLRMANRTLEVSETSHVPSPVGPPCSRAPRRPRAWPATPGRRARGRPPTSTAGASAPATRRAPRRPRPARPSRGRPRPRPRAARSPGQPRSTISCHWRSVRPRCLGASARSVRATNMRHLARCASVVQTFWPVTTQSSPSRTARVLSEARPEPESGSRSPGTRSPRRTGSARGSAPSAPRCRGDDDRAAHREAEDVGGARGAGARHLLVEDRLLDQGWPPSRRRLSARSARRSPGR